jgi:hypothetical protein
MNKHIFNEGVAGEFVYHAANIGNIKGPFIAGKDCISESVWWFRSEFRLLVEGYRNNLNPPHLCIIQNVKMRISIVIQIEGKDFIFFRFPGDD